MTDASQYSQPTVRVGAAPTKGSGITTLLFFVVIVIAVGAAGIVGVVMWGPEKTITNRSHLASDPPPAQTMPSLPASADAPPPAATESPAPADSSAPATNGKRGSKKTKGKKGR